MIDLGLLSILDGLREPELRDIETFIDILLRQNHSGSEEPLRRRTTGKLARALGWEMHLLREFLCGSADRLVSPLVQVHRIQASADFSLLEWSFFQDTCFALPPASATPLLFFQTAGVSSVVRNFSMKPESIRVEAGAVFRNHDSIELVCSFSAGSQALFFDFPPFRMLQRENLRLRESRTSAPVLPELDADEAEPAPSNGCQAGPSEDLKLPSSRCQIFPARRVRNQRRSMNDSM